MESILEEAIANLQNEFPGEAITGELFKKFFHWIIRSTRLWMLKELAKTLRRTLKWKREVLKRTQIYTIL